MAGKELRIGILTFWWSQDNYGQLLQCYALQKFLRDAGHDAFLIRYVPTNDYVKTPLLIRCLKALNPILLCRYMRRKIDVRKLQEESRLHSRHFDDFRSKYIIQSKRFYSSYEQLKESPPDADCYIVGSDQVWNFSFYRNAAQCRNLVHAYFLDFGKPETKRAAYAASWCCTDLRPDIAGEIRPLLAKFSYVSVREKNGVGLCRKCGCEKAEVVPDPTLLLRAEEYRKIYRENEVRKHGRPFVLLYMLGNECDFDIRRVYDFARSRNLDAVYVTGNSKIDRHEKMFATIPEWLSLVDSAEYVVTNSFHCCVFSAIFHKQFGIVPLSGKDEGMNTRMETLFGLFGIRPRWLAEDFSVLDEPVCPMAPVSFDAAKLLPALSSGFVSRGVSDAAFCASAWHTSYKECA